MATKATKLPSGSWRVRVEIESEGKRRWRSFTAPTRKEAEYLAAQYAYTQKESHRPQDMTIGGAISAFIDARTSVLSPSTIRSYRQINRCYFQDLHALRLRDLTNTIVQRQVNAISLRCSPKTVRNALSLLTSVLRVYHPDFPVRVDLPRKIKHEITIPSKEDVQRLLTAAQGTPLESAILLAAGYGLRRGEISALCFSDIDCNACTIHISKSYAKSNDNAWILKSPKSYAGTRTISVSANLIDRLYANRIDPQRVLPFPPDYITNHFSRLCDRLGMSFRFHDLRHYNASIMLAMNIPDKYAMERLGQSTPGMIKSVYQHIMSDKRQEVSALVNTAADALLIQCDTICDTKPESTLKINVL